MHELEDFLRQERDRGASDAPARPPVRRPGQVHRDPYEARTRTDESSTTEAARQVTL